MLGRVGTSAGEENTAAAVGSGSDKKVGVAAAASGPVKQQHPAPAAAVLPRQPLRPAAGINANISRTSSSSSVQDRLETSTIKKASAAPTPRGGAAWEVGVEAFTPARQRPQQPPLTIPRRELSFMGGSRPPSTAAKAAAKGGGSSNAQAGVSAPSARQEKVLCEWLNHTLLPPGPVEALPHPAVFLKVCVVGSGSDARCRLRDTVKLIDNRAIHPHDTIDAGRRDEGPRPNHLRVGGL